MYDDYDEDIVSCDNCEDEISADPENQCTVCREWLCLDCRDDVDCMDNPDTLVHIMGVE